MDWNNKREWFVTFDTLIFLFSIVPQILIVKSFIQSPILLWLVRPMMTQVSPGKIQTNTVSVIWSVVAELDYSELFPSTSSSLTPFKLRYNCCCLYRHWYLKKTAWPWQTPKLNNHNMGNSLRINVQASYTGDVLVIDRMFHWLQQSKSTVWYTSVLSSALCLHISKCYFLKVNKLFQRKPHI